MTKPQAVTYLPNTVYQARTCTCPRARAFSDDEGRCYKCGYELWPATVKASTSTLAQAIVAVALAQ